jgi:hypothetical protein
MARAYLAVVGVAYFFLGIWCAAMPDRTAKSVGFVLTPGSGQSEYFVVYGGLELALGIAFLWPLRREEDTEFALRLCCLIHSCLVVFRTASFFRFTDIGQTTFVLAVLEWLILLGAISVWWKARQPRQKQLSSADTPTQ